MITDPIADLLARLKNAARVGQATVLVPQTKLTERVAAILEQTGFITAVAPKGKKTKRALELTIAYQAGQPKIHEAKRVSKSSRRVYQGVREIRPVRHGGGILVLSTPQGLLTGAAARKAGAGGEALFKIW